MSPWKKPVNDDTPKIVYWAQLWRSDESFHGEAASSPAFDSQAELAGWLRENRRQGDSVYPFRREQGKGGFKNVPMLVKEPVIDRERLTTLVAELAQRRDIA